MSCTKIHDYLIENHPKLDVKHKLFLGFLQEHMEFLVGIEKYFLKLRDELGHFVWHKKEGAGNKHLIGTLVNKKHFNLLETKEGHILDRISKFRDKFSSGHEHDATIRCYLNDLELKCRYVSKFIRPELA